MMVNKILKRNTKQRRIILEELCKLRTHPDADTIFGMVRRRIPRISYGTVYRNLNVLRGEGKILELAFGKYSCRYDGTTAYHLHFYCLECKNIFDVEGLNLKDLDEKVADKLDSEVISHRVEFYGYCQRCRKRTLREGRQEWLR
jgi:Fe2+ or Zn2+ uptake regulation protein